MSRSLQPETHRNHASDSGNEHQGSMLSRLMTWWTFFKISVNERMVYRGDFVVGTLMRFLPTLTQIFLWWGIFDAAGKYAEGTPGQPAHEIAGFRFSDMVAYYLLVTVSRAFSSMPGLASGIALQIREGEVKKYLIQPVDMLGCLALQRAAHKVVYYAVALIPFAIVFFVCRGFFVDGWPDANRLATIVYALFLSFLLGFFLEACIGLIAFWYLEISSLLFVYMLLNFLLSGHMFPLDLLPQDVMVGDFGPIDFKAMVEYLPFKYLAYLPAAIFLGKIDDQQMMVDMCVLTLWVVFFMLLSRVLWHYGVKRYSGFGG